MVEKTLADTVLKSFSRVKLKKASVKVPTLIVRKEKVTKAKKDNKIPLSSVVNILIKTAVEKTKKERKEKIQVKEDNSYTIIKDDKSLDSNSGYGTTSKKYGFVPLTSYVDYGKLFSYLGEFRAQGAFENFVSDNPTKRINSMMEQDNKFYLVDREVIDTGVRSIKYFTHGTLAGAPSAVPMGNINSADWEKFKLWMIVDYVMFNLKMSTL